MLEQKQNMIWKEEKANNVVIDKIESERNDLIEKISDEKDGLKSCCTACKLDVPYYKHLRFGVQNGRASLGSEWPPFTTLIELCSSRTHKVISI